MPEKSPLNKEQILKQQKKDVIFPTLVFLWSSCGVVIAIVSLSVMGPVGFLLIIGFGLLSRAFFGRLKSEYEEIRPVQNDNFQITEDRVLDKRMVHHFDKDKDDSFYMRGCKSEESFTLTYSEFSYLERGDFFYYVYINQKRDTKFYPASKWYIDPSLQAHFVPWSEDDELIFVKKRAEIENKSNK